MVYLYGENERNIIRNREREKEKRREERERERERDCLNILAQLHVYYSLQQCSSYTTYNVNSGAARMPYRWITTHNFLWWAGAVSPRSVVTVEKAVLILSADTHSFTTSSLPWKCTHTLILLQDSYMQNYSIQRKIWRGFQFGYLAILWEKSPNLRPPNIVIIAMHSVLVVAKFKTTLQLNSLNVMLANFPI